MPECSPLTFDNAHQYLGQANVRLIDVRIYPRVQLLSAIPLQITSGNTLLIKRTLGKILAQMVMPSTIIILCFDMATRTVKDHCINYLRDKTFAELFELDCEHIPEDLHAKKTMSSPSLLVQGVPKPLSLRLLSPRHASAPVLDISKLTLSPPSSASLSPVRHKPSDIINWPTTEVIPNFLYLGNVKSATSWLAHASLHHPLFYVINVSACKANYFEDRHGFHYLTINVLDDKRSSLMPYFLSVIQFIEQARAHNAKVLVHCVAGISRSPTLILAYQIFENFLLQKSYHVQFYGNQQNLYSELQSKRDIIAPEMIFMSNLTLFTQTLNKLRATMPIEFIIQQLVSEGFSKRTDDLSVLIKLLKRPALCWFS